MFVVESVDLEASLEIHPKSVTVLPAQIFATSSREVDSDEASLGGEVALEGDPVGKAMTLFDGDWVGKLVDVGLDSGLVEGKSVGALLVGLDVAPVDGDPLVGLSDDPLDSITGKNTPVISNSPQLNALAIGVLVSGNDSLYSK